ncbi:MAG: PQQ-binding-like beta-propeller repeat protein [Armatimonadetes bacterium]|nr:PQQ-binding-like beta-propeller repeat protein [Armatimonadota bacterium]
MSIYWQFTSIPTPNNPAAVVEDGNTAYLAAGARVYAVNLADGSEKWRYPRSGNLPSTIQGTPAIADGTLYLATGEGLAALDTATGKPAWPTYHVRGGAATAPRVVGSAVYFAGQNGSFYGVDAHSGLSLGGVWDQNGRIGIPSGGDLVGDFDIANGSLIYITADQAMHSVNIGTGVQEWARRMDADVSNAHLVLGGEVMYVAAQNTLMQLRTMNGDPRWTIPLPSSAATPPAVGPDGTVYLVCSNRRVYAINAQGHGAWKVFPKLPYDVAAQPTVAGGLVIVPTLEGGVFALDAATGTLKWNCKIAPSGRNATAIPTAANAVRRALVANGALYVYTDDGTLTSFHSGDVADVAPRVKPVDPKSGDYLNGEPPFRVAATITDGSSGLNFGTLSLMLDSARIPFKGTPDDASADKPGFTFDPDTNTVEFFTTQTDVGRSNALSDGPHTATVSVTDWSGVQTVKTWTFVVDNTLAKRSDTNNNQQGPGKGLGGNGGNGGNGGGGGGG